MTISISVIFCVNKDQPYLDKALHSVLSQSFADFEFLISANNCSDDLFLKLKAYEGLDRRVHVYRTSIGQLAFNLNYLADVASGEYLVRMDADDVCFVDRFLKLYKFAKDNADIYDVIGSAVNIIDEKDSYLRTVVPPLTELGVNVKLLFGSPFIHPSVMLKRDWLIAMRGYGGSFVSEDKELWIRGFRSSAKMINISDVLLSYRIHSTQASRSTAGYVDSVNYWFSSMVDYRNLKIFLYSFIGFLASIFKLLILPIVRIINRLRFGVG